jgi:SAM-dependent methyltransferase
VLQRLHAPVYQRRLRELVGRIHPHLREGDQVLDVGCGAGALGRALLDDPGAPRGLRVRGLERARRDAELIEVDGYAGGAIPYRDRAFDVVILADVLHHEADPHTLIAECRRVSRRLLVIKDHRIDAPGSRARVALMDWAANEPHGVPCLYRYNTLREWRAWHARHGLEVEHELESMQLYPPGYNAIFGGRLQYMAVLRVGA